MRNNLWSFYSLNTCLHFCWEVAEPLEPPCPASFPLRTTIARMIDSSFQGSPTLALKYGALEPNLLPSGTDTHLTDVATLAQKQEVMVSQNHRRLDSQNFSILE